MSNSNNAATKQVKDNLKETKDDVLSNTENIIDEADKRFSLNRIKLRTRQKIIKAKFQKIFQEPQTKLKRNLTRRRVF